MAESSFERRLFSTKEAAAYLGVSERTVWTLGNSSRIPQVRFGFGTRKTVRYDKGDLDSWIVSLKRKQAGG